MIKESKHKIPISNYITNPLTRRLVLKDGRVGKKVGGTNTICTQSPFKICIRNKDPLHIPSHYNNTPFRNIHNLPLVMKIESMIKKQHVMDSENIVCSMNSMNSVEVDSLNNMINDVYSQSVNLNTCTPPPVPPNGSIRIVDYECEFDYESDVFLKNIICEPNSEHSFQTIIDLINHVLKGLLDCLFLDIIQTLDINFVNLMRGVLVSLIVDTILEWCDTVPENSNVTICRNARMLTKVAFNMKLSKPETKGIDIIKSFIITKTRNECGFPKLQSVIKDLIINYMSQNKITKLNNK
jgi:hypothetical protein